MSGSISIEMKPVQMPEQAISQAKALLGFDYGPNMYHVLFFDFGDDGGAVGIQREGSNFIARLSLDSLAQLAERAQAAHLAKAAGITEVVKGRLTVVGQIDVQEPEGGIHRTPMGLLVEYDNRDELRAAIAAGRCEFTWGTEEKKSG